MTFKVLMKHNPAFLSQEEIISSFAVRDRDLNFIVDFIGNPHPGPKNHLLIVAPRGRGKTMLVLRAAAEIVTNKDLSDKWYPIVFSEDNYGICNPGEFWLEALHKITDRTEEQHWRNVYESLRAETNEDRLYNDAFSHLMAFSDQQKRQLLLIVENLQVLLDQQISSKDVYKLYDAFANEPRIKLLATACFAPKFLENPENPLGRILNICSLDPLDSDACLKLCAKLTARTFHWRQIRPLEILTGGNPRELSIMASAYKDPSQFDLWESLIGLMDESTAYYKNRLENLPPQERKVLTSLAEKWRPATAREISKDSGLNVNLVSAHLQRLLAKGEVEVTGQKGRKKWYQIAERMYNIYILLRRGGQPYDRIRGIVDFMKQFYRDEEQVSPIEKSNDQAVDNDRIFLNQKPENAADWVTLGNRISENPLRYRESEQAYERAIEMEPSNSSFWNDLIKFQFEKLGDDQRALNTVENYLNFFDRSAPSLNNIAWLFFEREYSDHLDEAENWCREALGKDTVNLSYYYHTLAAVLGAMGRWKESFESARFFLKDKRFVQREIGEVAGYFINAASEGHAGEGILILEPYADIVSIEPLLLGLEIYMGQENFAVHEIQEIGQDIAKHITERRNA